MATEAKVKWSIEADYIQSCNCDYGCPCEFEAPPTQGHCDGIGAWRIKRGKYGSVSLDGLGLGFALHAPEALHKGNITLAVFIDAKATAKQRESLLQIASGKAGGMPFEIFPAMVTKLLEPQYVSFEFKLAARNGSVKMGPASIAVEPIKNPVTGASESVRVEHATGFIFKSAEALAAKVNKVQLPGLSFSTPDKAGFIAQVKYSN